MCPVPLQLLERGERGKLEHGLLVVEVRAQPCKACVVHTPRGIGERLALLGAGEPHVHRDRNGNRRRKNPLRPDCSPLMASQLHLAQP